VASGTTGQRARRQRGERDDGVASGTTGWRAGRRGRDRNRGGEAARRGPRAANGTAEVHFGRLKWREATEKLPKYYRNRFRQHPLLSKPLPNFGRRFRYRPVPYRNPTENLPKSAAKRFVQNLKLRYGVDKNDLRKTSFCVFIKLKR
jgi:hypothetical protein